MDSQYIDFEEVKETEIKPSLIGEKVNILPVSWIPKEQINLSSEWDKLIKNGIYEVDIAKPGGDVSVVTTWQNGEFKITKL